MLQRKIEIQELTFVQVNILGCYLPSRTSIESVLEKIRDKRNKKKICSRSNELVILHGQQYDLPSSFQHEYICKVGFRVGRTDHDRLYNLSKKLAIGTAYQCELAGYSFVLVAQSMFAVGWFEGLVGDFDHDNQKLRKISGAWLERDRNHSKSLEKYADLKPEPFSQRMAEYPGYTIAKGACESFNRRIHEVAIYNGLMRLLIRNGIKIMHQAFTIREGIKDKLCITFCPECQTHFTSKRTPALKICGSCREKSKEQKKASRRKYHKVWVFDRIGNCKRHDCENKRNLNTDGICRSCHEKNDF